MNNIKVLLLSRLNRGFSLNLFQFFIVNIVHLEFILHCIFLFLFFPKINKPNKHNNVIGISSLQNWLYNLFNSTGFHFKSKVIEGSYKGKNMIFFNIWAILLKMYYFCVCDIFFSHSGYPINSYLINWLSNQQYVFERCF